MPVTLKNHMITIRECIKSGSPPSRTAGIGPCIQHPHSRRDFELHLIAGQPAGTNGKAPSQMGEPISTANELAVLLQRARQHSEMHVPVLIDGHRSYDRLRVLVTGARSSSDGLAISQLLRRASRLWAGSISSLTVIRPAPPTRKPLHIPSHVTARLTTIISASAFLLLRNIPSTSARCSTP
jgi:hypothetical protein